MWTRTHAHWQIAYCPGASSESLSGHIRTRRWHVCMVMHASKLSLSSRMSSRRKNTGSWLSCCSGLVHRWRTEVWRWRFRTRIAEKTPRSTSFSARWMYPVHAVRLAICCKVGHLWVSQICQRIMLQCRLVMKTRICQACGFFSQPGPKEAAWVTCWNFAIASEMLSATSLRPALQHILQEYRLRFLGILSTKPTLHPLFSNGFSICIETSA